MQLLWPQLGTENVAIWLLLRMRCASSVQKFWDHQRPTIWLASLPGAPNDRATNKKQTNYLEIKRWSYDLLLAGLWWKRRRREGVGWRRGTEYVLIDRTLCWNIECSRSKTRDNESEQFIYSSCCFSFQLRAILARFQVVCNSKMPRAPWKIHRF